MKTLLATLAFVSILALLSSVVYAKTIPSEHRACATDADCSLVSLACCPCGNGDSMDAVNNKFAKADEHQCTRAEIHACAEQGACARTSTPVPVCRNQQCAVDKKPFTY